MDGISQPIIEAIERLSETTIIGQPIQDNLALAVIPAGKKIEDLQPFLDRLRTAPRAASGQRNRR